MRQSEGPTQMKTDPEAELTSTPCNSVGQINNDCFANEMDHRHHLEYPYDTTLYFQ